MSFEGVFILLSEFVSYIKSKSINDNCKQRTTSKEKIGFANY